MKRCCTCRLEKPLDAFHRRASSRDGRQNRCKSCFAEQYRTEGPTLREKVRRRDVPLRADKLRRLAAYLIEHPCVDCGESDLRVLDFDHRDAHEKRNGIGQMLLGGWNWERLVEEMAKCDVRCANCHRVRTAEQQRWWRHTVQLERDHEVRGRSASRLARVLPE